MTLVEVAPSDDLRLILCLETDRRAPFDAVAKFKQSPNDRVCVAPSLGAPGALDHLVESNRHLTLLRAGPRRVSSIHDDGSAMRRRSIEASTPPIEQAMRAPAIGAMSGDGYCIAEGVIR